MKLIYEPGDEITLRKLKDASDDLEDWGMDEGEFARFVLAAEKGHIMEVVSAETEEYYNLKDTVTGDYYDAISSYHFRPRVTDVINQLDL